MKHDCKFTLTSLHYRDTAADLRSRPQTSNFVHL